MPTLTGRIRDDIAFVEEIIGVGEISVSELGYAYDSNGPGAQYVAEAATAGLLAGRLARKRGYLCLQVPPYHGACLKPVMDMLDRTGLPIAQLLPSHVNQTDAYMADATLWARRGGYVDVGANYSPENNFSRATPPAKAVTRLLEAGVPLAQILLSSDGNGAPPKEEQREGQPAVANYMPVGALHGVWRRLIVEEGVAASDALRVVTSNAADATGLRRKGRIAPGLDADLIAFDADWRIRTVIARGRVMVERGAPIGARHVRPDHPRPAGLGRTTPLAFVAQPAPEARAARDFTARVGLGKARWGFIGATWNLPKAAPPGVVAIGNCDGASIAAIAP